MENETVFAEGFIFKRPRKEAPDFVKGSLALKVDEAIAFLQKHKKADGWVNLDLLASKDNSKLYFKLNDWKPKDDRAKSEYPSSEINPEDIPFN